MKEIHEKSPAETVKEFFAWMFKKAINDNEVIFGKVGEVVYEIDPNPKSLAKAMEDYEKSLQA